MNLAGEISEEILHRPICVDHKNLGEWMFWSTNKRELVYMIITNYLTDR